MPRVLFLGTGNAFADGGRSHACVLVRGERGALLIDCGGSSLPAIRRAIDPREIGAVAVSHLHGDHFGGLPYLALQQKYAPRSSPLVFAGPPSLEARYRQAATALFGELDDLPYDLGFIVLGERAERVGPAEVTALPVDHVPRSEPHGLRVEIDGRLIAYSGDARWSDALVRLADGADLFICEATGFRGPEPVHITYRELLEHRDALRCKRIIATHLGAEAIAHLGSFELDHAEDGMEVVL